MSSSPSSRQRLRTSWISNWCALPVISVTVCAANGRFVAAGYCHPTTTIAVRVLTLEDEAVDGALVEAVRAGDWVLLENANFAAPSVVDRLNGLLEPGGRLVVSEAGPTRAGRLRAARPRRRRRPTRRPPNRRGPPTAPRRRQSPDPRGRPARRPSRRR